MSKAHVRSRLLLALKYMAMADIQTAARILHATTEQLMLEELNEEVDNQEAWEVGSEDTRQGDQ